MSHMQRHFELYDETFKADPYPTYAEMRATAPVHRQPGMDGETMLYFATTYHTVSRILTDDHHFARDLRAYGLAPAVPDPDIDNLVSNHMLQKDGADHRRLRTLVSQAFTPRRIKAMRPNIQAIADELVDNVAERGAMDLIGEFAYQLPTVVILELIGVPVEDRDRFRGWTNAVLSPALDQAGLEQLHAFLDYLRELIAERTVNPTDDLLSALVAAEESGNQLTEGELFGMLMLLIVAGHETTVNLIANAMLALWNHPEQKALLQAEPALMPRAVEEFLRYDGSVERAFVRYVRADLDLDGVLLPEGSLVIPVLGGADRDESVFAEPDTLDITRTPNQHLGFGQGSHYCLGAPLARLETEIALNTLLRRLPDIEPAVPVSELRWRPLPTFRALESLPVRWTTHLPA